MFFSQKTKEQLDSIVGSALFIGVFAFALNGSLLAVIVSLLVGAILGGLAGSYINVLSGLLISLVMLVTTATLLGALIPTYSFSGTVVLFAFAAVAMFLAISLRFVSFGAQQQSSTLSCGAVVTVLVLLIEKSRNWTSVSAFDALVQNGEDNAAWLIALSRSVVNGETRLSISSNTAGGPGTGVLVSIVREAMDLIGRSPLVSSADNGLVLMRSYVLIGIVMAFVWAAVAMNVLAKLENVTRLLLGLVAGVVSYSFVVGLAAVGHFSAVVALLFLSISVFVNFSFVGNSQNAQWIVRGLVFLSVIAAGQSWFPLTGMAFIYLAAVLLAEVKINFTTRPTRQQIKIATASAMCVGVFGYFSYTKFFGGFLQNVFDISYITRNLTLAGEYPTVNAWLVVSGFLFSAWWATTYRANGDLISDASLLSALLFPIVALFTWSYFLSPYTPQYGAWKYLYLGAAVTCPLAVIAVGALLKTDLPRIVLRSVPVLLVFVFALFTPPFNNIQTAFNGAPSGTSFSKVVVSELRKNPLRPVGCLTTSKLGSTDTYEGYLCSRMAFGLGGFDEYVHRTWTAANICQIPPAQAAAAFEANFQKNFTVVLFDGTRTSSFTNCQAPAEGAPNGWLSSINWDVIRKVDTSGKVVSIPATQFER
jgi:hypothetical protein